MVSSFVLVVNMKSIKIFGACLVLLGLFTGVCVIIGSHSVDAPNAEIAYRFGMLMGSAVVECAVGSLLVSDFLK